MLSTESTVETPSGIKFHIWQSDYNIPPVLFLQCCSIKTNQLLWKSNSDSLSHSALRPFHHTLPYITLTCTQKQFFIRVAAYLQSFSQNLHQHFFRQDTAQQPLLTHHTGTDAESPSNGSCQWGWAAWYLNIQNHTHKTLLNHWHWYQTAEQWQLQIAALNLIIQNVKHKNTVKWLALMLNRWLMEAANESGCLVPELPKSHTQKTLFKDWNWCWVT